MRNVEAFPNLVNTFLKLTFIDGDTGQCMESRYISKLKENTAQMAECYSSNGRVVQSVCLLSCRLGFDSESGQTNDFKNWYSQLPYLTLSIKGTVWRTSRQVYLLCRWEWHLAGLPHLGVLTDGWQLLSELV